MKEYHGENSRNSVEYRTYTSIKTRCNNKKYYLYCDYGGRGIKLSPEWNESYLSFLRDMGRRPKGNYSIERIDNNKGYSKENCKWILLSLQARNRRSCVYYKGETISEASIRMGISRQVISWRIKRGWPKAKAFNTLTRKHCSSIAFR